MDNGACSYRRFLDGDESAFEEIVNELFDNLIFFINRYVNDMYAAEDIAIDVFADLTVNRHRYNFKVKLKTYIFMLGRSKALNYIKHRKIFAFEDFSALESVADEKTSIEEKILADERKLAINNALDKLGEDMRIAVHLVYFENLSYEEAAKVMKKNRKQIANLLYRAKKELGHILSESGDIF